MSVNYADGLSPYMDKGVVGRPEIFDDVEVYDAKIRRLVDDFKNAKFIVILVGAGISTAAGIPDFRGPSGVWTLEKEGKTAPSIDFADAQPTFTHSALVALEKSGKIKHLISQNVDGLVLKGGFPADRLMEVHGNFFVEKCNRCNTIYYNKTASTTFGVMKPKKDAICSRERCRGRVFSTVLDWEERLPSKYFDVSERYVKSADLFLILGSSLEIHPVGNLPSIAKRHKAKVVSVNLQEIGKKCFDYKIYARVDDVMKDLMKRLEIEVVPEIRPYNDPILHSEFPPCEDDLATLKSAKRKKDLETSTAQEQKAKKRSAKGETVVSAKEKLAKKECKNVNNGMVEIAKRVENKIATKESYQEKTIKNEGYKNVGNEIVSSVSMIETIAAISNDTAKDISSDVIVKANEGAVISESVDETICSSGSAAAEFDPSIDVLPDIVDDLENDTSMKVVD